MSVVRDLILQADDDLRYPTSGELRTMVDFLDQGAIRVSVVRVLTDNEKKIVDESARQLFARNPLRAPGGTYGQRQRTSACAITAGIPPRPMEFLPQYRDDSGHGLTSPRCTTARVPCRRWCDEDDEGCPSRCCRSAGQDCCSLLRLSDPGNADIDLIQYRLMRLVLDC